MRIITKRLIILSLSLFVGLGHLKAEIVSHPSAEPEIKAKSVRVVKAPQQKVAAAAGDASSIAMQVPLTPAPTKPHYSLTTRFMAAVFGSTPKRIASLSTVSYLLLLAASPVASLASSVCPDYLSGTGQCHLAVTQRYDYSSSDCRYACVGGRTIDFSYAVATTPGFRVDSIGGHLVGSCSGSLNWEYQQANTEAETAERDHAREQEAVRKAEEAAKRAQDAARKASAARDTAHSKKRGIEARAAKAGSGECPRVEADGALPLPGSASKSCKNTRLTSSYGDTCTYETECGRIGGGTRRQTVSVRKGAADCRTDGTSTTRQECCHGVLTPRKAWEGDDQCTNEKVAKDTARAAGYYDY